MECLSPEEMRKLQLERFRRLVDYLLKNSSFSRQRLQEAGVESSAEIKSLSDVARLPFTLKTDLRDNYPFGMFCVPLKQVAEIHASSGTTGNPTVVAYTKNDLQLWSEVMARTLAIAGATPTDIIQNAYGYGLFTGGLGVHYGALELGAAVVPMSSGGTKRQIKLMHDYENIIGESEMLNYVLYSIEQVAPTDTTVLILGESGTGKELIARAIHHGSKRKERPLIKMD